MHVHCTCSVLLQCLTINSWYNSQQSCFLALCTHCVPTILDNAVTCQYMSFLRWFTFTCRSSSIMIDPQGGNSYIHFEKKILKRTPKRYQNLILWAWLKFIFIPKRYQYYYYNNKTKMYRICCCYQLVCTYFWSF